MARGVSDPFAYSQGEDDRPPKTPANRRQGAAAGKKGVRNNQGADVQAPKLDQQLVQRRQKSNPFDESGDEDESKDGRAGAALRRRAGGEETPAPQHVRDDVPQVRVGGGAIFRPRDSNSVHKSAVQGLGVSHTQGSSARRASAPKPKSKGPAKTVQAPAKRKHDSDSDTSRESNISRRKDIRVRGAALASKATRVRQRASSDSDDSDSDEYVPAPRSTTANRSTAKAESAKDHGFSYSSEVYSSDDDPQALRIQKKASASKKGLNLTRRQPKGVKPEGDQDHDPPPRPKPSNAREEKPALHLWTHKAAIGPQKDIQVLDKEVGPIRLPFMWSSKADQSTQIQKIIWPLGAPAELGGLISLGELVADHGGGGNLLRYPLSELRNVLSSASYRYWKKKTDRIEEIFLPNVIDVNVNRGKSEKYLMIGFSSETEAVFYGRKGVLPDAVDMTDLVVRKLVELDQDSGKDADETMRPKRKKFVDPDEADTKERKKQADKSAKAKEKDEQETAKKKAKACGGKVKKGAKAGAAGDEDEEDEFIVKIQDPKLALLVSKNAPAPLLQLSSIPVVDDDDDGWITA